MSPPQDFLVLPQICFGTGLLLPCRSGDGIQGLHRLRLSTRRWRCGAVIASAENSNPRLNVDFLNSTKRTSKAHKTLVSRQLENGLADGESDPSRSMQLASGFASYEEDPLVGKLRTQLGVLHPIPTPPINRNIIGFFVFFFFVGVAFDKVWTSRKKKTQRDVENGTWPQVPTSFSMFFEKDLQRKESVEWVNMVLVKLWKVYRSGIENWIIGLLQPVIDNLKKPSYVQRVEIKQFSLGDEPLSVRNVERRTSRRVNDLQYQIGLRYTGGARMLLSLTLKFGIIPIVVPVGIRDFDIDGELWVKLRLIPTEPWIGAVSWAFVSLPKIKFELSPFRLFNLMAIPVLSLFLTKLLTEDLPRLFVRPKKIVLDFQKGTALVPVPVNFKTEDIQEGNKDFVGELSVTLVDARKLAYVIFGKTDPFVVLNLGDQEIRSKKNSQTTVIGAPGEPIWNQDFHLLVADPRKQKLYIQVKDSIGFTDFAIGTGEVELGSLQDTVPTDRVVALRGGWNFFRKQLSGELLLRLTYKAYVEDEEDAIEKTLTDGDASDDESSEFEQAAEVYGQTFGGYPSGGERESFMDVLAALLVSEEFLGIVSSETATSKATESSASLESPIPKARNPITQGSTLDANRAPGNSKDSTLVWLAVATSIAVLIAINVGGSGFFNP
ncbi:synaptotagmin-3-like [Zingiber officinale]|uniref:synaptotagmin-3-like n=1 Tax=Zingiber officinale TaxID=94328 RepID=UPI001C4AEF6D|nr:synaptotagmin-3-like [Zingiber officinale]